MTKKILVVCGVALFVVAVVVVLFVGQNVYFNNDDLTGTLSIIDDYNVRFVDDTLESITVQVFKQAYGTNWDILTVSIPWEGFDDDTSEQFIFNNLTIYSDRITSNRSVLSPVEKVTFEQIVFDIHGEVGSYYLSLNSYEGVTVHSKFNVVYLLQWLEQVQVYQDSNRPLMPEQSNDIVYVAKFIGYVGQTIKWGADWVVLPVVLIGGAFVW